MILQLAESIQYQRTPSREWMDAVRQIAQAIGPENGLSGHLPSTTPVSRRLPTADDIRSAAMHRLRRWTPEQISEGIDTVTGMLPDIDESLIDVPDRRDTWTAVCALAVLHADSVGDLATFWSAGSEVLAAHQQARRASLKAGAGDSLSNRIAAYLAEGITSPAEMWGDLCRIVEEGGDAVVDAHVDGRLLFQAKAADQDLTSISYETFRRRVQRVAKLHSPSVSRASRRLHTFT